MQAKGMYPAWILKNPGNWISRKARRFIRWMCTTPKPCTLSGCFSSIACACGSLPQPSPCCFCMSIFFRFGALCWGFFRFPLFLSWHVQWRFLRIKPPKVPEASSSTTRFTRIASPCKALTPKARFGTTTFTGSLCGSIPSA